MDSLNVCAVCMHSEPGRIDDNLEKIRSFCSKAHIENVHVICFPELSVTGYVLEEPLEITRDFPLSYILKSLQDIASEFGLTIIAGLVEPNPHKPYITQVIVGKDRIIGKHRKTHLSPIEKAYQAGDRIELYKIGNFLCGIQLCYETHFPELSTIMAIMGAEIIFCPYASPRGKPKEKLESWLRYLTARAFDNSLFLVACNQVGKTRNFSFPGVALVIDPLGKVRASFLTEKEDMLIFSIKREEIEKVRSHRMKYFLPFRRPELYTTLLKKRKGIPLPSGMPSFTE